MKAEKWAQNRLYKGLARINVSGYNQGAREIFCVNLLKNLYTSTSFFTKCT